MAKIILGLYCQGERRVFGTVELTRGNKLSHEEFLQTFKVIEEKDGEADHYRYRNSEGKPRLASDRKTPLVRDGMQVTCPRCGNGVLIVEKVDGDWDLSQGVFVVPGAMRIAS